jgi:PHD/YefM family antitoxin component YafN of YafNO toxin-antitoxin module
MIEDVQEEVLVATEERYLVDGEGNRVAVMLDLETYRRLPEAEEELEDIRAYDAAKAANDEAIPFDQALAEIEAERAQRKAG